MRKCGLMHLPEKSIQSGEDSKTRKRAMRRQRTNEEVKTARIVDRDRKRLARTAQSRTDDKVKSAMSGGPERANNFVHLRTAPAYSAPQMTRAGTRLSTDSEWQENSDLTDIIKRVPACVFFTFLMVSVSRHFYCS